MIRKFIGLVLAIVAVALGLGLTGCEEFNEAIKQAFEEGNTSDNPNREEYRPRFVMTVNSLIQYPRAGEMEKEIDGIDGKTVWINSVPIFSSKNISDVRVVARPGDPDLCDLQCKTDRAGKLKWQVVSGNHRGEPVAFIVDGVYFGSFLPESLDDDESDWITVRIGIDSVTAGGIVKYAKKNYIHYHPSTTSWF